jgi:hypothetical protein
MIDRLLPYSGCLLAALLILSLILVRCEIQNIEPPYTEMPAHE